LTSIGTHAKVADATLEGLSGSNNSVSVQALNNTIIDTASGAAARSKGAPGTTYTVGLAGAVAVTLSGDMTTANIERSTVTAHKTTVQALAGGESTTVGLAVALTAGSGNGAQASASVSVAQIDDGVQAGIDSSTVGSTSPDPAGDIAILAYRTTDIGIGAGSLYGGGGSSNSNGFGVSMTYAEIGDPSSGAAVSAVLSNSKVWKTAGLDVEAFDTSRIVSGAATAGGGANASGFSGSVVVNDISPTILAEITAVPTLSGAATVPGGITVSGDVIVSASAGSVAALDKIISDAAKAGNNGAAPTDDSGLDFSGGAVSPTDATGAAIIAVAGNVQVGKSNVGVSIVVNRTGTRHEALIDHLASVTSTGGVVDVSATDNSEILGIAVGVGGATGAVAGNGSVAYNAINNAITARIGDGTGTSDAANQPTATVEAAAVQVSAQDNETIRGAAGAISVNIGSGNAVGLSAAVDQIATDVSAATPGANVKADNALGSDSDPLIADNLQAGSILVSGSSSADITTIAVGAAISAGKGTANAQSNLAALIAGMAPGGGTAPTVPSSGLAGAGSLALSTEATSVHSTIDSGGNGYNSSVAANNNVLVLASNTDSISAYAGALSVSIGGGKGVGAAVVVNKVGGKTSADISNSTVDAHAKGNASTVSNGMLATAVDPSASRTPATDPSLATGTTAVEGIAIVATSRQTANTVSATYSMSPEGLTVSANAITNVMGGTTEAKATSSSLNTNLVAGETSGVDVTAFSGSYANNLDVGLADAGSGGSGTIVQVINTMNRTTTASVDSTDIGSSSVSSAPVVIFANAFQGTAGEAVGAAGSAESAAVTGSALANLFQSTTTASLDHGTVYSSGLSVTAKGKNGFFAAIGSGALGSGAGIGATVLVTTSNNTVKALVGDDDPTSAATKLYLTGALTVQAADKTVASAYVIVGSIGKNLGISAQFSGLFINNTVDAELDNTTVSNTATAAADGAITVSATENDSLAPVVGGVAGGGTAGIGAAVNLVILKSNTKALMAGDTVTTGGVVSVSAHSNRDVNPITVNAGLGGQVGFAGTVGVVLIGSGASSDELSVLNAGGTLGSASSATGTNVVAATGSGVDGISAQIVNGSTTAGEIDIKAQAQTSVRNIVGALAVGIKGGFGAAVGFTEVDQKVTAKATDGSLTAPTVSIDASAGDHNGGHAAETWGVAGAGGLYVGLGAAVGKSTVDNTVTAELGATTDGGSGGGSTGVISVSAGDTSSLASHGLGFAGGVGAVGLSLAFSQKSSTVTADIAPSTSVTNVANVAIAAAGSGAVDSAVIAGAAGILSGAGASAHASDSETIKAQIGDHASVSAAGASGVMVSASATPKVSANSFGVAAGGVAIGVSVADATAAAKVTADVGDDSTISDGSLTIIASVLVPQSGHSADAYAVGSGGGGLLGAQATVVKAENDSSATAYGGKNLNLPAADVTIASEVGSNQLATATGIAVGYIGVGATVAEAFSNTHSIAYLDTGAVTASNNVGALSITATGNDTNKSDAIAGSGGGYAGAAAVAKTSATSVTTATLKGDSTQNTLYFGGLGIYAAHAATYEANGNAVQASAIGASGGSATNSVTSTTTTEVGPNLIVNSAGGDMNVIASDTVSQNGGGAQAGSGGVASGAAALSDATVKQDVTSHIDHDTILSLNADPLTTLAAIDIEAYNFLSADDTVSLNAGGLYAGGGAHSTMHANATDSVLIDDGVTLFSAGSLFIGTASQMDASNYAIAKLYGLITGAGASTNSSQSVTQVVSIGNAKVEGWGPVDIYAGQSGDGAYTTDISSYGNTVVYNYALIPITAEYKGQSSAESHSTLTLAPGSQILGVGNVFLGATPGSVSSTGNGTNYNPYLKLVSTEKHDNAGKAPVTSSDVVMDGTVAAGIHNREIITISYDGAVTLASGNSPDPLTLEYVSDPSQFDPTMSYNHQTVQWTLVGSFSPYNDAVNQIASLSGLTATQVKADIAANQPIPAQGDDAAGTKQREIDTLVKQLGYLSTGSGPAYRFGNVFASAGNVSILAGSLRGTTVNGVTPSVAARGSAGIGIDNQGIDFLFLSDLTLSGISGGRINFTGAATDSSAQGVTFSRDLSDGTPSIIVDASYSATNVNREPVDRNGNVLATTPDIYFGGPISNENGLLSVTNLLGNVLITRDIRAGTVVMTVPNGMIGGNLGANSVYNTNYDVASQWSSVEYRPTNILTAVYAAATYLGTFPGAIGGVYVDGNPADTPYYYYTGGGQDPQYAPINDLNRAYQDLVFTARMMAFKYHDDRHAYNDPGALYSAVFLPTDLSYSGSNNWVDAASLGHVWGEADEPPFAACSSCVAPGFPIIHLQNPVLNGVTSSASGNASSPSTISAGKAIILSAAVININGNISAGQSSNYSVDIGANAENYITYIKHNQHLLARYRSEAAAGKYVDLSPFVSTINGSDVKVTAKYDVLTGQILLDPVVQGVGGYVYLNGKIISTSSSGSPMGNITVHGGAGTVTVNNTTSVPLVTNIINTGVSAASVVELVDHAKKETTWYVYDAGAAANRQVSVYQQAGVNNSGGYASLSPVAVTANAGLSYQPADMLYQWTDTAHLTRSGTPAGSWSFDTSGNGYGSIAPWTRSSPTVVAGTQDTNFSETLTATGSYTETSLRMVRLG
ncbi:MAG: leukotoxin LktA family filamentous adhesin, partial [Gammaproteobacteria bacterium]